MPLGDQFFDMSPRRRRTVFWYSRTRHAAGGVVVVGAGVGGWRVHAYRLPPPAHRHHTTAHYTYQDLFTRTTPHGTGRVGDLPFCTHCSDITVLTLAATPSSFGEHIREWWADGDGGEQTQTLRSRARTHCLPPPHTYYMTRAARPRLVLW